MEYLESSDPVGRNDHIFSFEDVTVTETEYYYKVIDWHQHEIPYFSFVLEGHCRESNRRKTFECAVNSLLFHNTGDAHYNIKSGRISRGFQVEIDPKWCKRFEVDLDEFPASTQIIHPAVTLLFYNLYKEARLSEATSNLTIDALLTEAFETMRGAELKRACGKPSWVVKIDEILRENNERCPSLLDISREVGVHWAHISREFPRYFRCNFSQYSRKIKVERSLGLLRGQSVPLADIAFICGFADQSHFIRCFKNYIGVTPLDFRRLVQ